MRDRIIGILVLTMILGHTAAYAVDATSTNFILRDPVIGTGGGYASSGSFKLFANGDNVLSGANSSTNFLGRSGFEYYPYIQSGVLSAVLNVTSIDATWSASSAGLGYTVSTYKIGIATVSGGPYTYTTLGNVTSYTYSDQAPGTYYMVVQTLDPSGTVLATSNEATMTVPTILSFSISDNSIGFGTLSSTAARYATGDTLGSSSETEAHQLAASTNGSGGYAITVQGATLAKGASTIAAIGGSNTASSVGTAQFGLRMNASGGTGAVTAPYAASGFAYAGSGAPSQVAGESAGDGVSTTYSARYLANITSITNNGAYAANLTYVLTTTF